MESIDIKDLVQNIPITNKIKIPNPPSKKEKEILEEECLQNFIDGGNI